MAGIIIELSHLAKEGFLLVIISGGVVQAYMAIFHCLLVLSRRFIFGVVGPK